MILSMSGKHKDQAGFTIFEAALILIIVSLIAGTAWYVLHAKQQANKVLDKAGQTAAQHASTLQNNEYGHVNNYYYFYSHPQAACSDSPSGQDIQSQTQSVVKTMVPVLEAIPQ
jgi:archaellum component FlaF (FlaF/FlaG flagellin family)